EGEGIELKLPRIQRVGHVVCMEDIKRGERVRAVPDFLITWIAYCLLGWIFLDLVRRFRVASFTALFLCGAVFGWVDEGVVVDTLYGNPTNPFPLSISFTGLAWHAMLSVCVGWYL